MRIIPIALTGFALLCSTGLSYSAYPVKTFKVCKGEFEGGCSFQPVDFFVKCGDSETPVVQQACTVIENGVPRVRGYTRKDLDTHDGNNCGYWTWEFQCGTE